MADNLGKNLEKLRREKGLSQGELSEKLGVNLNTYASWERGRTEPSTDWLIKLADFFGVSVDSLLRSETKLSVGFCLLKKEEEFNPIENLNGFFSMVFRLVFSRLYFFDAFKRRFNVELAPSWRIDKEDFSYTFYIYDKIKFHDGKPLELDDIKDSYDKYIEKSEFFKKFIHKVEVKKDENAIKLILKRWLEFHELPYPYILPRSCINENECFIGTGPFKVIKETVESFKRGETPIKLERNKDYFAFPPQIENVEFHRFDNTEQLKEGLDKGIINFAIDIDRGKSEKFNVEYVANRSYYLVLKPNREICKDPDFRKAIDYAINRDELIETMKKYLGIREDIRFLSIQHLYNCLVPSDAKEEYSLYDPDQAKKFLKKSSSSAASRDIKIAFDDDRSKVLLDIIVKQLQKIGINAIPEGEKDIADASISAISFDRLEHVYINLHSPTSEESWGYRNPTVEAILDGDKEITKEIIDVKNNETRKCKVGLDKQDYEKIQDILISEHIFIPLLRHGIPITYSKSLNVESKYRVESILYGPDVARFKFE